ncbi:MAG: hypothetical protein HY695_02685 [Deltaproteobacteria bacterium]|nr:hypothetical protein [Deltaproteobacteria bacterium]
MNNVLLSVALTVVLALSLTGNAAAQKVKAAAQAGQYGTEICVNASYVEEAKRLFPNYALHVIPDFTESNMNGWRIVSGSIDPNGRIMTDAEEIKLRQYERNRIDRRGLGE